MLELACNQNYHVFYASHTPTEDIDPACKRGQLEASRNKGKKLFKAIVNDALKLTYWWRLVSLSYKSDYAQF